MISELRDTIIAEELLVEMRLALPLPILSTRKSRRPLYLYLMSMGGLTKIGVSHDPHKRRKQLSSKSRASAPRLLWYGEIPNKKIEAAWHEKYADRRAIGEWFNLSLSDISNIAYITSYMPAGYNPWETGVFDDYSDDD